MRETLKRLLTLSGPIIGLNVLNVLALAVDTAMCGRLPDAEVALTALGFSTQIIFLLMVAMMGVMVGSVALVARAFGAGDAARVNHVMRQSTMLTLAVSAVVALGGNALAGPILGWMGASGPVQESALLYLRPLLWGTAFNYLFMLYGGVLRGVGNTSLAFMVSIVSNIINFVINYFLILGHFGAPALGIQGAAVGTLASQAVGVVLLGTLIRRGAVPQLELPLRWVALDRELWKALIRIGAPAALDMVILNAGFLSIVGMLGQLEEVAVAAHGIGLRIQALAFVPGLSVAQATGALVGQALGAGDAARARRVVWSSIVLCLGVMSTLAVVIVLWARTIVGAFDVDPDTRVGELAVLWMQVLGAGMPIAAINISFVGMLQGAGSTRISLIINTVVTLLIQIPLSWALGFGMELGPLGVWLGFPLSFLVKVALGGLVFRFVDWARTGGRGDAGAPAGAHQPSRPPR